MFNISWTITNLKVMIFIHLSLRSVFFLVSIILAMGTGGMALVDYERTAYAQDFSNESNSTRYLCHAFK